MKFRILLSFFLVSFIQSGCTKNTKSADVVAITYDYGDFIGKIYFGINDSIISKVFEKDTSIDKSFLRSVNKYVVKKEILMQVENYIVNNCYSEKENSNGSRIYRIDLFNGTQSIEECHLSGNEKVNKYFSNLIKQLEASSYSREGKQVIDVLKVHVR